MRQRGKLDLHLKDYESQLNLCMGCGYCRDFFGKEGVPENVGTFSVCPVRERLGFDTYSAKGRITIAKGILSGKIQFTEEVLDVIYRCCMCGNCKEHCISRGMPLLPSDIETTEIFKAMRTDAWEGGAPIPKNLKNLSSNVEVAHNIFGLSEDNLPKWVREANTTKHHETVYFPGCTVLYRLPEIGEATLKILNAAKVKFSIPNGGQCCGRPLALIGNRGLAEKLAKYHAETFQEMNVRRVITSCPSCYRAFKFDLPHFVADWDIEVMHVTEFFSQLIDSSALELGSIPFKAVAYHDPCELGRESKIYEPPRKVIEAISGVELIEFARNKGNAQCCGAGGGVLAGYPDLAESIAADRVVEVADQDTDGIVSACPTCKLTLREVGRKIAPKLRAFDISEILAMALK